MFGKKEFSFFPTTYVLPYDMKGLKRAWEDGGSKAKWIIKPVCQRWAFKFYFTMWTFLPWSMYFCLISQHILTIECQCQCWICI